MANEIEENLNTELDKFNGFNDNTNNAIKSTEENFQHDMTPRRMFGVALVEEMKKEKTDPLIFVQIVHNAMTR